MIEATIIIGLVLLTLPLLVYVISKMATFGYLRAREQYRKKEESPEIDSDNIPWENMK